METYAPSYCVRYCNTDKIASARSADTSGEIVHGLEGEVFGKSDVVD